jgi:hypothetical protein
MNFLPTVQNVASIAWDGTASSPKDVTAFNNFGFSFEVTAAIAADAVFKFQSAPPSAADPCVPGAFTDVVAIARCVTPAVGALETITIPAGTVVGSLCAGSIPCKSGKFLQIVPVSGTTANVKVTMTRQGPQFGVARKANPYA